MSSRNGSALALVVEHAAVRDFASSESLSIEDAARRLRYAFLERAAAEMAADRIAVGHTQDDQAETVLLKLMRGAGLRGLGGIYPRRGAVIRPLLDVTRDDLRAYLQSRAETWIEDETNQDLANPRNRIRHRVLPELDRALEGLGPARDFPRRGPDPGGQPVARRARRGAVSHFGALHLGWPGI